MSEEEYDDRELEQAGEEERVDEEDATLASALAQQWQSAPWYVSSVAIHCLAFLLLCLIPMEQPKKRARRIIISTEVVEEEKKIEEPENDIVERDPEVQTETTNVEPAPVVVTTDFEISDHNETDDDMDMATARGDPDSISTFDDVEGSPALMGVGHSGGKGGGGRFGNRNGGGRRNCVARGGGSRRTESAVNWALKWLAAHQEPDGHWDCAKYGGAKHDVAITSLALLAFLGAGNSTRFGKYKTNVRKGVYWLMQQQQGNGMIGKTHRYEAGIALMAAAEAFGMSGGNDLKQWAQKAVDWAAKSQCVTGGWDYTPHLDKTRGHRVDTSVTGWWVMGLKSAKVAGLKVPYEVLEKALKYTQRVTTDPQGDKGYGGICTVNYGGSAGQPFKLTDVPRGGGSTRLTAVGLTCLQFLGRPRTDGQVLGCANKIIQDGFPNPNKFNFYRWYYAALGLFQMGIRSDYWRKWNGPMKKALLSTQVKVGTFKQNKGSWNYDTEQFGKRWGRVGQTALGALMLEVYYRYYDVHTRGHNIMKKGKRR